MTVATIEDKATTIDTVDVTKVRRTRRAKSALSGETKTCGNCGLLKPIEEYRVSDGHPRAWCNPCAAAYNRDRRERLHAGEVLADKWCTNCGQVKPMEDFSPSRSKPDGRNTWCRDCVKGYIERHPIARKETADEASETPTDQTEAQPGGSETPMVATEEAVG